MSAGIASLVVRRSFVGMAVVLGVTLSLLGELVEFNWRDPAGWLPDLAVGWAFLGAGLIVAGRLPGLRAGALLVAVGLTWFLGNLRGIDVPVVAMAGAQLEFLHRAVLAHLLLTFPTGRTRSRLVLASIVGSYVVWSVPALADNPALAVAMVSTVVLAAATQPRVIGRERRWARAQLAGTLASSIAIGGATIAHLVTADGSGDGIVLLAYEGVLAGVAIGLTAFVLLGEDATDTVTDLVVELGGPPSRPVVEALRLALGDPSVEVGTWDSRSGRYVDSELRAVAVPSTGAARAVTRLDSDEGRGTIVIHDPGILEDPPLVQAIRRATLLATTNADRNRDVAEQVTQLQASTRRLLLAGDTARQGLRALVEAGALAQASVLRGLLQEAAANARGAGADVSIEHLRRASSLLDDAVADLEALAAGLHPAALVEGGLSAGIARLASYGPLPIEIRGSVGPLAAEVEAACYYVVAEALANVVKHAKATSAVVSLRVEGPDAIVEIADDGVGGASMAEGRGLQGLADRVGALGGVLEIGHDRRGTRVTARIPVSSVVDA